MCDKLNKRKWNYFSYDLYSDIAYWVSSSSRVTAILLQKTRKRRRNPRL